MNTIFTAWRMLSLVPLHHIDLPYIPEYITNRKDNYVASNFHVPDFICDHMALAEQVSLQRTNGLDRSSLLDLAGSVHFRAGPIARYPCPV